MSSQKNGRGNRKAIARADRELREAKGRADKLQLRELPVHTLEAMDAELDQEQRELIGTIRGHTERIEGELSSGHGLIIEELRRRIRHASEEHQELGRERLKVYEARQQRILEDRLIRVLGSKGRVKALETTILSLIVTVVGMLIYDLATPGLSDETRLTISIIDVCACVIFLGEFFFRHHFAESKRWYWRRHWIDFVTSIPLPTVPQAQLVRFGRLARLARLARLVRVLRVVRVVFFFWRGMDKLENVLDVRLFKRSLAITVAMLIVGAGMIFLAEQGARDPAGVESFTESVWWSFTTVVTGGFGDIHNPTTLTGRIITVLLVIAGMTVVGIFTATLTSVLVGDESERLLENQDVILRRLDRVTATVAVLANRNGIDASSEKGEAEDPESDSDSGGPEPE